MRAGWRLWAGVALVGLLVVVGNGLGLLLVSRVVMRIEAATAKPLAVTFKVPPGFIEDDHDYNIAVPLYKRRTTRWIRPTDESVGLDVIFVNSYVTGEDARWESSSDITKRIAGYDHEVSAVHATKPIPTRVDHMSAWTQYIYQPLPPTTERAMYDSTYVFIGQDLVQIGCQWEREKPEIMTGCGIVLRTLRISG